LPDCATGNGDGALASEDPPLPAGKQKARDRLTPATKEGSTSMNTHRIGESGEAVGIIRDQTSALRQMTAQQLLQLGARQVVYLKAGMHDGERLFVLYGADGSPLAIADAVETAAELAAGHGLAFVSVH
jgi:hypothetical protein